MLKTITVQELKEKLKNNEVLLVDVREPEEYQTEFIEGSYLIPLGEMTIAKLPITHKPIVLQCRSGKRSSIAAQKLLYENPDLDIYNLEGGIEAWKALK